MNEVEEMRDAFGRVERNLERFRWIITHPVEARNAIDSALKTSLKSADGVATDSVLFEIDRSRGKTSGRRL